MQVAQADVLGLVDNDGIGVGDVQAVLDDGRAQKHIIIAADEVQHPVFQFLGFHLSVRDTDAHIGNQPVEYLVDGGEFLHLVVQEEYLPSPVKFVVDDALYFLFVEQDYLGLDRNAVRRRSVDDGKVAGSEQRELERTGNRSGSKGQRIH